jgi:tetratricopeptide (TPR) repeat protein
LADEPEFEDSTGPRGGDLAARLAISDASEEAREYLRKQSRLADLQIEDMARENAIRHWSLRVRHVSDVMKLGFELALAFIAIAVAVGLGVEIWAAAHADGLVIEAFNVPPAMAEKGLTGQVMASKLLDQLTVLQNETISTRAASSFANDWTNDIKVEIPDTGVSIGEIARYLHSALGHEMHLFGDIYQTPKGDTLTVRLDNDVGQTFTASANDLDALTQRAALAIFAHAQPYRYSVYLLTHDNIAEAYAVSKALAETGPASERPWGYIGMTNALGIMGRLEEARYYALLARQAAPNLPLATGVLGITDNNLSHEEASLREASDALRLYQSGDLKSISPQSRIYAAHATEQAIAELSGDYRAAGDATWADRWLQPVEIITENALDLASAHDVKAAAAKLASISQSQLAQVGIDSGDGNNNAAAAGALVAMAHADWQTAIDVLSRERTAAHNVAVKTHGLYSDRNSRETVTGPMLAILYARIGDWAKADAMLKMLPDDCDICVRAHGKVETVRRNWNAAARWFAMVSARSPDIPFADSDWGAMLLAKGDLDGAIAKFSSANKKGPHFADPLEMWGEALIAKNRSDLALAKFADAGKYAPNWGRLHLKWGEALLWSGSRDDAVKQFDIAAELDLTAPERAELARMRPSKA